MLQDDKDTVLLVVEQVSKVYGDVKALDGVSFHVQEGEILGLIGPNGAGKTTLLECLTGLLPSDGGRVVWQGTALSSSRRKERMFYLPDSIAPYADQPVATVLDFFRAVYAMPPNTVGRVVADLALDPVLAKKVGALSKGYRRRLLLALALLSPQPLLIIDEPFDGFDLRQSRAAMSLLRLLRAQGRTLLLSIHQLSDAQHICDRFVLLSNGRVRGVGTLDDLRRKATIPSGTLEEVFLALT